MARPADREPVVTGVLVATGVVTVCCGGHHPAPGEASTCLCCAECVTNAEGHARPASARAAEARADREALAAWWPVARAGARYARQVLMHGEVDDRLRVLRRLLTHAVALPRPVRPEVPELDAACLRYEQDVWAAAEAERVRRQLRDDLFAGFTGAVPA